MTIETEMRWLIRYSVEMWNQPDDNDYVLTDNAVVRSKGLPTLDTIDRWKVSIYGHLRMVYPDSDRQDVVIGYVSIECWSPLHPDTPCTELQEWE